MQALRPDGVGVLVEATHTCMTIRGVEKPGALMVTSAVRGGFRDRPETRAEFFALLERRRP
jgi:GTP cyclohydrolase I